MEIQYIKSLHHKFRQKQFEGRYLTREIIQAFLSKFEKHVYSKSESVENRIIKTYHFGSGEKKIFIWSQMHGNETTGTKALIDLFAYLDAEESNTLRKNISLYIIPILNPDGAVKFTRTNAQGVDMNRDVLERKSPEINFLIDNLERIKPDYCFNLHDQRNIFNPKGFKNPATLSFLAPSENPERSVGENRLKTMRVIADVFSALKSELPRGIGRYSDEFYPAATGDNFQKWGFPTVLFEAGHYRGDLERERVRAFNFYAIMLGIQSIIKPKTEIDKVLDTYLSIPENDTKFFDVITKDSSSKFKVAYLYHFEIIENRAVPYLKKERIGDLDEYWSLED